MPVSPYTNALMKALPGTLRPNPFSIDEYVMEAVQNGWDIDELARASYINERNPNPAFVVTNIRNMAKNPPKGTPQRTGWEYGHLRCVEHADCTICRCVPGQAEHHRSVPVPLEVKKGYAKFVQRSMDELD